MGTLQDDAECGYNTGERDEIEFKYESGGQDLRIQSRTFKTSQKIFVNREFIC